MEVPQYRVPLPKGASQEAIDLSKEVNKWANIESKLLFQVDDLETVINELDDSDRRIHSLKAILREKESALKEAEEKFEVALHKMCKAL